jgi:hypothetical protein
MLTERKVAAAHLSSRCIPDPESEMSAKEFSKFCNLPDIITS